MNRQVVVCTLYRKVLTSEKVFKRLEGAKEPKLKKRKGSDSTSMKEKVGEHAKKGRKMEEEENDDDVQKNLMRVECNQRDDGSDNKALELFLQEIESKFIEKTSYLE